METALGYDPHNVYCASLHSLAPPPQQYHVNQEKKILSSFLGSVSVFIVSFIFKKKSTSRSLTQLLCFCYIHKVPLFSKKYFYWFFGNFTSYTPVILISSPSMFTLVTFSSAKWEIKSPVCAQYTYWSIVKLPVALPLKKIESFLHLHPTRSRQLWRTTLQHP